MGNLRSLGRRGASVSSRSLLSSFSGSFRGGGPNSRETLGAAVGAAMMLKGARRNCTAGGAGSTRLHVAGMLKGARRNCTAGGAG